MRKGGRKIKFLWAFPLGLLAQVVNGWWVLEILGAAPRLGDFPKRKPKPEDGA